ncbi:hypothetical protein D5278_02225 [bacterium 1XD21-13]|nr:hypothetical protein [bacterium 1XD21-13]
MKAKLIVMLTLNDITVDNAIEVFESCKDLQVDDWGFKNVGLCEDKRYELARLMKQSGKKVYIEDVLHQEQDVLEMAKFALETGADHICARYYPSVKECLVHSNIKYYASSTKSYGSPVMLRGPVEEIVDQLKEYEQAGIDGVCIGAYRHESSPEELIQKMKQELKSNIIIAGSIDSKERMRYVNEIGCYGFTMGSAIFNHKYVPNGDFRDNLIEVMKMMDEIR